MKNNGLREMLLTGALITILSALGIAYILTYIAERSPRVPENEEMEKRGVTCNCASHPNDTPEELTKTASGDYACPHCGKPGSIECIKGKEKTSADEDTEIQEQ